MNDGKDESGKYSGEEAVRNGEAAKQGTARFDAGSASGSRDENAHLRTDSSSDSDNGSAGTGGRRKIVRTAGNILMILALVFIVRRLWIYRESLTETVNVTVIAVIVVSVFLCGGLILIQSHAYRILAGAVCGTNIPADRAVRLYAKSNLYKYLPGNVFHFVGRNQIAEECSLSHADIAFATVLEIMIQCGASVLPGLILSFGFVTDYLTDFLRGRELLLILLAAAFFALVAAAAVLVKKKFSARWERVKGLISGRGRRDVLRVILLHVMIQLCNGTLFLVLLQSMGGAVPANLCGSVIGVYCFAWLVGFVTPGAPGGLGIREAMLTLFLGPLADPGLIAAAVLLNRIVTVFGDLAAYVFSLLLYRTRN